VITLSLSTLQTLWFMLVGILFTGYAILDGFDLGVGILHLIAAKTDEERRLMLNSIGPVWDGNEVWLVTGGGALFAAFPDAYATVFSGFYLAMMLLLFALIFRAVAIEFRSKLQSVVWRRFWDVMFSLASVGGALILGVALGNIALGIPLNAQGDYTGTLLGLLNPYALLMGITTVALFAMHAGIYLVMKLDGPLQTRIKGWIPKLIGVFGVLYGTTTLATLLYLPHMTDQFREHPVWFGVGLANILAIANVPREISNARYGRAFISSCLSIVFLLALFGLGVFPNMVYSNPLPLNSLTAFNASSSANTLTTMLLFAGLALPIILSYTIAVYWIFRGKVTLDSMSY
jgi:cytochrome bd ubiquinol oxidase subunit II